MKKPCNGVNIVINTNTIYFNTGTVLKIEFKNPKIQESPTVTKIDIKTRNSFVFSRCSESGAFDNVP